MKDYDESRNRVVDCTNCGKIALLVYEDDGSFVTSHKCFKGHVCRRCGNSCELCDIALNDGYVFDECDHQICETCFQKETNVA